VSYVARLIIHRYAMLGILDEEGHPVQAMGVLAPPVPGAAPKMKGMRCPECSNYAVIRKDGCDFCSACGWVGCAGSGKESIYSGMPAFKVLTSLEKIEIPPLPNYADHGERMMKRDSVKRALAFEREVQAQQRRRRCAYAERTTQNTDDRKRRGVTCPQHRRRPPGGFHRVAQQHRGTAG